MNDAGAQIINLANIRRQRKWQWLDDAREICSAMEGLSYNEAMMMMCDRMQFMHDDVIVDGNPINEHAVNINEYLMDFIFTEYGVSIDSQKLYMVTTFNAHNRHLGYTLEM